MKNYTIEPKRDDCVLVKQYNVIIEISAQIDTQTVKFKTWKGEIEYHARLLRHENDPLANWVSWDRYITQDAYNAAVKQLDKNLRAVKRDIKAGKNHPLYTSMQAIASKTIKHFREDFTYHDTLRLARCNPVSFVWIVRESGAWLLTSWQDEHEILKYSAKEGRHDYYLGRGEVLRKVSYLEAENALRNIS